MAHAAPPAGNATQDFLDQVQYKKNGVLRYEWIFGAGFISTGGIDSTKKIATLADLKPGMRVLDVGCGIGGGDVFISDTFGVEVVGIDLSTNCVGIAQERYGASKPKVAFKVADALTVEFPEASFDLVYSRDTILHIHDKDRLFANFNKWLKPGGKVLITDYCCAQDKAAWNEEFAAYVAQRGYHLLTPKQYGAELEKAGFKLSKCEDATGEFVDILKAELGRLQSGSADFLAKFSQADFDDLKSGWEAKLVRCAAGQQAWGLFLAEKP